MNRQFSFFLLGFLIFLPTSGFAAVQARIVPPLEELGGLLRGSLAGVSQASFFVPAPSVSPTALPIIVIPAIYDLSKPAIMLNLAGDVVPAAAEHPPRDVIRAVNAVLKDFTPEALRRMPLEALHGVAGVILDQLQGRPKISGGGSAAVVLASASAEKLILRRGQPLREITHNSGHHENHPDLTTVYGVPEQVVPVKPVEGKVYRHYTTEAGLEGILKTKSLRNGFMPYVQTAPGVFRKTFMDVTGFFLTLPEVGGYEVGVPRRAGFSAYVDVILPAGLPLFEIEKNAIYLVPLPDRTRDWLRNSYLKWANGGAVSDGHHEMIRRIDEQGGMGPEIEVPVTIVGYGKVQSGSP